MGIERLKRQLPTSWVLDTSSKWSSDKYPYLQASFLWHILYAATTWLFWSTAGVCLVSAAYWTWSQFLGLWFRGCHQLAITFEAILHPLHVLWSSHLVQTPLFPGHGHMHTHYPPPCLCLWNSLCMEHGFPYSTGPNHNTCSPIQSSTTQCHCFHLKTVWGKGISLPTTLMVPHSVHESLFYLVL